MTSAFAYNPDLLSKDELVAGFVARRDLLARLVEDLRGAQVQHHLLIGQRGMGKTTILRRLALEIERDPELAARWLALTFPEEQYNVAHLSDLWLNCLDALADALEQGGESEQARALDRFVSGLPREEGARAAAALDRLLQFARTSRGLVLCIDNADLLLDRLGEQDWAFRETLEEDRLVFVGAAVAEVESAFAYGRAFYDFFQIHWLSGLSLPEMREVVGAMAAQRGDDRVKVALAEHPARLAAMHVLTGGNPRTVVLLYQVLNRDPGADVRSQLEALLDQVTPLYKARFEALPSQAQVVLDSLASAWDPRTAAEVAELARMETTSVSTQLHRLHQGGVVEKVELPGSSRLGFQMSERFFNVWYLMRASRRQRQRLLSLARCLETLYGLDDLESLASQVIRAPSEADFTLALSKAMSGGTARALAMTAIDQSLGRLDELRTLLGPDDGPVLGLLDRKARARQRLEEAAAIDFAAMGVDRELGEALYVEGLEGEELTAQARARGAPDGRSRVLDCWIRAVRNGDLASLSTLGDRLDVEGAARRYDCPDLIRLFLAIQPEITDADFEVCLAIGEPAIAAFLSVRTFGQADRALRAARRWTELSPGDDAAWSQLALASLSNHLMDTTASARAYALGNRSSWVLGVEWARHWPEPSSTRFAGELIAADDFMAAHVLRGAGAGLAPAAPDDALRFWRRAAELADPLDDLDSLVHLLAGLVHADRTADAFALVDRPEIQDRARPLYAAMTAVVARDPGRLRAFAPEVAEPARRLLDAIWPPAARPPDDRTPTRKRRRPS